MNKGQMSRHTAVVLLANTASLIFGLLATVAVAHYFGSGRTVDALFIALSVPQVAGQILLSVALVAIVPVYARYRSESDRVTAQRQIAPVFYASALILGVLSLGVVFAAPLFIQILAPGFDAAAHREAVMLLRWMSPLVLLLGLSGLLQGIQNADHSFACPAWSKLLPTAFALLLLAVFAARAGVVAYAWGMLVGAAAGLAWQFALVYRSGGFAPRLKGIAAAAAHLRVGLAAIFGARIMGQAGVIVTGIVASTVAVGAVSTLGYAFKIVSVPFLAASSFGVVLFPVLTQAALGSDRARELRLLWKSVRAMALMGLAATVPLLLWAGPLIQFLFERGEFTPQDTAAAASALRVYALGIVFVAVNTSVGNAYWAKSWFGARLRLEAVAVAALVGLALLFGHLWGASGLALALVVEFAFLTVAGLYVVQKRAPVHDIAVHGQILAKMGAAAAAVALLTWPLVPALGEFRADPFMVRAIVLTTGMSLSGLLFLAVGFFWAFPEIDDIVAVAFGRFSARGRALDGEQRQLIPARIRARLRRQVQSRLPRRRAKPTSAAGIHAILGPGTTAALPEEFRNQARPPGCYDGEPASVSAVELELAVERALMREVDLLGSGPVQLGRPIQWSKDYVSGYEWPAVHHTRIVAVDLKKQVDCKFPWEVARCQHWPHLASAVSERARAINELATQFREFTRANPPGVGINYGNAMEVAIRAVNWLAAFRSAADALTDGDIEHLAVEMDHAGRFISANLESVGRGLNTNHYIADLLGLYVISTMLPCLPRSSDWYRLAGDELTAELPHQFDPNGAQREGSPYYARLVTEFYLYAYLLGRRATDPRVDAWRDRLEAAVGYLAALAYPDGTLPSIGDDDAGRLLVPPGEGVTDIRYMLQIGAVLFERADWKTRAGSTPRPGLEFWLGPEAVHRYRLLGELPPRSLRCTFEPAGLAVVRSPETMLVVQGGRTEMRSPRAHLHNDLTSFEFFADGVRWILDPGTYQYTRLPLWRNRFRSTSAHNVIQIDDLEQNRWNAEWLFYLSRDASPEEVRFEGNALRAGYSMPPGLHVSRVMRTFSPEADGRIVQVRDFVEGSGRGVATLGLNLAREKFTYLSRDLIRFDGAEGAFLLLVPLPSGFAHTLKDGWFSPRFGVRERCFRFEASGSTPFPHEWTWAFAAVPEGEQVEAWAERLTAAVTRHADTGS